MSYTTITMLILLGKLVVWIYIISLSNPFFFFSFPNILFVFIFDKNRIFLYIALKNFFYVAVFFRRKFKLCKLALGFLQIFCKWNVYYAGIPLIALFCTRIMKKCFFPKWCKDVISKMMALTPLFPQFSDKAWNSSNESCCDQYLLSYSSS